MRGVNINSCWVPLICLFLVAFTLSSLPSAQYQDATTVYDRIKNLAKVLAPDITRHLYFCVKDVETDWNRAFKFDDLNFLSDCMKNSKEDITNRICSASEIKFFFETFFNKGEKVDSSYVKPNNNCNLSSWVNGCEPGWGCALDDKGGGGSLDGLGVMPFRTRDCQPCCAGFFCPPGLTCMIPCPLGSYCPRATLNKTSGLCDPYGYQVPPGDKEHTCGGADIWAAASSDTSIFCSPGSYCPTTIRETSCSSGHFCRMGSTAEIGCFRFAQCSPNTAKQTLHIYGFMVIVGLAILLILIYSCSDRVLSARERKIAKSKERAARKARQAVHARERWKMARDLVKKRTTGFQTQFSRAMSRKKTPRISDPKGHRSSPRPNPGNCSPASPSQTPSSSRERIRETNNNNDKKNNNNLTSMMQALEDDPESLEGINVEIGDKKSKKKTAKDDNNNKNQHYSTHSLALSYAYGRIEKERAILQEQSKDSTYSGVISMAGDRNVARRPLIEVAFKDLTLTLKGKNRHLLRSVTGKFRPGRVSAVMGPSGAGKTTFLSALAGKVVGCTRTGFVLINGRDESIRSYKKIVGFVPQDDIVHGNLTVEENLKFSAECRLPVDMPRLEKVLVIERVIDFLGLHAIRDSIVGTVEQRGISGGQKKRVNVGLEMVIEPSLLILDEPTSGLDSSSSMLLLRALRREALEGVNICMVLHQPSYSLFKMFDDLVLLAKGGLVAYQGPVKKAEEYFAGMGMVVPDRINPPDHFIDVLEGMVTPNSGVAVELLPVKWMLHNNYHVPQDMLHYVDEIDGSTTNPRPGRPEYRKQQSLAGELWEDVKFNVGMKKDDIEHRFSNSKDLTNRVTPGVLKQYRFFLGRVGKQRLRDYRLQVIDYLILLLAGACLGFLAKVNDETFGARGYTFTVIAVSLLCKIAALRSFSQDRLHYWRESGAGMSSLAYFLSKDTIDHFNTVVKPVVYLSMFYFFNSPRSSFVDNYLVLLCLVYCVTGMAYVFAIWLDPGSAQLWSVIVPVVLTLVANQDKDSMIVKRFGNFCYSKWAMEGFIISNAERYNGVWLITRCDFLRWYGYDIHNKNKCLVVLIIYGVISRFVAYICLLFFQKK